jgi:hypothetical protein
MRYNTQRIMQSRTLNNDMQYAVLLLNITMSTNLKYIYKKFIYYSTIKIIKANKFLQQSM